MATQRSGRRGGRHTGRAVAVLVAVAVVALAIGAVFVVRAFRQITKTTGCSIGSYELTTDQASVAAQMVGAVSRYRVRLPARAAVLVLMAGLQESKLTNIPPGQGDRDSVGVLQQRPSQGWGNYRAEPLTDPTEATTEFLDHLTGVRGWRTLPPANAIQAVQVSADGSLYAQHEPEARVLAAAFSGRAAAVSCSFDAPTVVATPRRVQQLLRAQLPAHPVRTGPGTVAVTVSGRSGWQVAAWLVAYADRLGIAAVRYDGRRWTRSDGWGRTGGSSARLVVASIASL